jgi:hypothetical protein
LAPNQSVVAYEVSPRTRVRLATPSPARAGAFPASLPKDAILFQVGLDGIDGYCSVRAPNHGERRSQCFIDINNDGKFDASYITNRAWHGQAIYWGQVASLASIPALSYTSDNQAPIATETMTFYFKRVRNGKAEFQIGLGPRNNGLPTISCPIDGTNVCRLGGHRLVLEAAGASVKVLSITAASDELDIVFDRP